MRPWRIDAAIRVDISTDKTLSDQCYAEAWKVIESYYPARTSEAKQNGASETTTA